MCTTSFLISAEIKFTFWMNNLLLLNSFLERFMLLLRLLFLFLLNHKLKRVDVYIWRNSLSDLVNLYVCYSFRHQLTHSELLTCPRSDTLPAVQNVMLQSLMYITLLLGFGWMDWAGKWLRCWQDWCVFHRWVFIYEKGYQSTDTAISSVLTKMKGVGYTNVSGTETVWDVADYVFPSQVSKWSAEARPGHLVPASASYLHRSSICFKPGTSQGALSGQSLRKGRININSS